MRQSIVDIPKKRGRKFSGGRGGGVMVRMRPEQFEHLDGWIARQAEPRPTRPEAIRQLVERGLAADDKIPIRGMKPPPGDKSANGG